MGFPSVHKFLAQPSYVCPLSDTPPKPQGPYLLADHRFELRLRRLAGELTLVMKIREDGGVDLPPCPDPGL